MLHSVPAHKRTDIHKKMNSSKRLPDLLGPQHSRALLVLCLILALATALRFYDLGAESFSYDEGIMIHLTESLDEVIFNVQKGRPPLIVVLGFVWVKLFGASELASRSLSAVAGILSVAVLYAVGRELFSVRVGLAAALLMSVSVFHVFYSQDYRYYSLLAFVALLSFFFYIRALRSGQLRYFVAYVISGALVFYAHYHGAFILTAQGIYFLLRWHKYPMRVRQFWFFSQIAIILGISPSLYRMYLDYTAGAATGDFSGSLGVMGKNGPLRTPPLWIPMHTLLVGYLFITIDNVLNWIYLGLSILFVAVGTATYIMWRGRAKWMDALRNLGGEVRVYLAEREALILLGCWLLIPVLLPFALSLALGPIYMPRYTIGALPALCLALAMVLVAIRRIVPEFITLGALLILIVPGLQQYYVQEYKDQWVESAAYVGARAGPADAVAFVSINNEPATRMQNIFNRYYAGTLPQCTIDGGLIPADEVVSRLVECSRGHERVWLITRVSKDDSLARVDSLFFAEPSAPWRLVEQQHHVGITIHLLDPQPVP